MKKLARQITDDKIQELNEKVGNVDNQVLRYLTAGDLLSQLIGDYVDLDDAELFFSYYDVLKEFNEEYQETIKDIKALKLEIPLITVKSLLKDLNNVNDDINYLIDRLKDIKKSMLKKELVLNKDYRKKGEEKNDKKKYI